MDDWVLPTIDLDRCTSCGLCAAYCPTKAVEMIESTPTIARPLDCAYCGDCEEICPEQAIELSYEIIPIGRDRTEQ